MKYLNKTKWHIYFIVIGVLMLSLISWASFAKKMGSNLKAQIEVSKESI